MNYYSLNWFNLIFIALALRNVIASLDIINNNIIMALLY